MQNSKGDTALMGAAIQGHPAVVLCLLQAGADTKARSAAGKSALVLAKEEAAKPATADAAGAPAEDHAGCVRALSLSMQRRCGRPRRQRR